MFTIFKKKQTAKSSEQIIAEIHSEFDSASEKILQEAKDLISGINTEKADRLRSLGFAQAKPVTETQQARQLKEKNEELARKVEYFKQWYPHNKFITEEAVRTICEKYGLVFGDASYYRGDVPEKNVLEMEAFSLRKEDMRTETSWEDMVMGRVRGSMERFISHNPFGPSFIIREGEMNYGIDWGYEDKPSKKEKKVKPAFKICAPESDFDMTMLSRKGHKLELNIPDPIVLQPVNGGYLIVTKWGLEASDEIVRNEKDN